MNMNQSQFLKFYVESQDDISNSISLYVKFFKEQSQQNLSNEILNMYNKQLCENNALLMTILSWFSEWSKKAFTNKLKNEMNTVKNIISNIQKKNENDERKILIKQSRSLTNQIKMKQVVNTGKEQQNLTMNRQLFYGALFNQLIHIYRSNLSAIQDLDIFYLKTIKKNQLKAEIILNISKIAKSFANSMFSSENKKAIEKYKNDYLERDINFAQQFQTQERKISKIFLVQTQSKKKTKFINQQLLDSSKLNTANSRMSLEFKTKEIINSMKGKNIGNSNLLFSKRYVEYNLPHLELSPRQTKQSRFNQIEIVKEQRLPLSLKNKKHLNSDHIPKSIGEDIHFSFSKQQHNRYISLSFKQKHLETSNLNNNNEIKKDQLKKKQSHRIAEILKILQKQPLPSRSNVFYLPKLNKE